MREFGETSMLTLAASIGTSDLWVMAAWSEAVTLTPLRMLSRAELEAAREKSVLLCLSDLGHLGGSDNVADGTSTSPLRSMSDVVLLLSWSLLPAVAELDLVARRCTRTIPDRYAAEDWLTTWHHFVEADDQQQRLNAQYTAGYERLFRGLPFVGAHHVVLGTLASKHDSLEFGFTDSEGAMATVPNDDTAARRWPWIH
jgi:hypothetical protein